MPHVGIMDDRVSDPSPPNGCTNSRSLALYIFNPFFDIFLQTMY